VAALDPNHSRLQFRLAGLVDMKRKAEILVSLPQLSHIAQVRAGELLRSRTVLLEDVLDRSRAWS
jgi:hypothetical protein